MRDFRTASRYLPYGRYDIRAEISFWAIAVSYITFKYIIVRLFEQRDALLLFYKNGFAVPNENRDSSIINDINILTQKQLWISH